MSFWRVILNLRPKLVGKQRILSEKCHWDQVLHSLRTWKLRGKKQKQKRLEHNWWIHSYTGANRLMFRYCCVFIYVGDTDMGRKMLQSPYVLLQDCGSSTLFSLLLSFGLNLWVGLNDPCVLGSVTQNWVCTHNITHLAWHRLSAGPRLWLICGSKRKPPCLVLFFFPHPPDDFCISRMEGERKKKSSGTYSSAHVAQTVTHVLSFHCVLTCVYSAVFILLLVSASGSVVSCNLCA